MSCNHCLLFDLHADLPILRCLPPLVPNESPSCLGYVSKPHRVIQILQKVFRIYTQSYRSIYTSWTSVPMCSLFDYKVWKACVFRESMIKVSRSPHPLDDQDCQICAPTQRRSVEVDEGRLPSADFHRILRNNNRKLFLLTNIRGGKWYSSPTLPFSLPMNRGLSEQQRMIIHAPGMS